MSLKPYTLIFASLALSLSAAADAKCFRAYVCDDKGKNCKHEDVCPSYSGSTKVETQPLTTPAPTTPKPISILPPPATTPACSDKTAKAQSSKTCTP